jgi:eukaryotic-like serine/threonine-protein kinase
MEPDRWERIERLYHAAAELPQERRVAFLEESCAGDETMRREVESLLEHQKRADDFLEVPALQKAAGVLAQQSADDKTTDDKLGLIGETISHYRVIEKLGGGGMGVVYKGEDTRLGRFVALKFLPQVAPSDPMAIERFKREARAASALNHPHICIVHDIGAHEGQQFIVMELLEGKTLKYHVAGRSLEVAEVARLGAQIAEALEAAHAKGIVHRDIKPANIFLTESNRIKVLDFGLAKLLLPAGSETTLEELVQTRGPIGTLPYMAPEQVLGRSVDARADIYGLGMVLYEMTAGRRPFREDLASHLTDDILHQMPAPPGRFRPGIPARLEEIILKCLEKDPAKRYQSAQELKACLEQFVVPSASGARESVRGRSWYRIGGLTLAGVALAAALVVLAGGRWRTRPWGGPSNAQIASLAVLPLTNLTGDPQQEYFVDGMTDQLTTDLAQIGALRVTSRTSAMQFKGTQTALPRIAQDLHVDAVVEGSVARFGDRVRITAQLIDARNDRHLWARSYERNSQDLLTLQDQMARDIASEINVTLTPAEHQRLAARQPVNREAYEDYLRGRYFWNRRTEDELNKAKDYFSRAIAKDPNYAPAYSGLADTYFYLGYAWGHMPPREAMPLARAAAEKSVQLDDDSAEGHASLGTVKMSYDWDFPGAEQELKRATTLNPNYSNGHHAYSVLLGALGRPDESVAEIRKAAEVDPLSIPVRNMLAGRLHAYGRCDEALAEDNKTLELVPNAVHLGMIHQRMADCYRTKNMESEAVKEEVKKRIANGASPTEIENFRHLYAKSGRKGVLQQDLQDLLKRWDKDHWHTDAYFIAMVYAGLDDLDHAFAWIDRAIELKSTWLMWLYIDDNPLRHDPRFAEVKRKMGVRE